MVNETRKFRVPEESARFITDFVTTWCRQNYDPKICGNDRHVILKALASHTRHSMINTVGDISEYWALMLAALQHWFPPDETIYEVRVFRGMLNDIGGIFGDQGSDLADRFNSVYREFQHWIGNPWVHVITH